MALVPTGIILQPTYRLRSGVPVVRLFGRLDDGGPFLIEDDRFRPYFFLRTRDLEKLKNREGLTIEVGRLVDLEGQKVARIGFEDPAELPRWRQRLEKSGTRPLEGDLRFPYRYLMDHGLRAGVRIEEDPIQAGDRKAAVRKASLHGHYPCPCIYEGNRSHLVQSRSPY